MRPLLSHWGSVPVDFIQALFALQYHFPRRKRGPASGKSLQARAGELEGLKHRRWPPSQVLPACESWL